MAVGGAARLDPRSFPGPRGLCGWVQTRSQGVNHASQQAIAVDGDRVHRAVRVARRDERRGRVLRAQRGQGRRLRRRQGQLEHEQGRRPARRRQQERPDKGKIPAKHLAGVGVTQTFGKSFEVADNAPGAPQTIGDGGTIGTLTATCNDQSPRAGNEDPITELNFVNNSGDFINVAKRVGVRDDAGVSAVPNGTVAQLTIGGSNTFFYHVEYKGRNLLVNGVVRQDGRNSRGGELPRLGHRPGDRPEPVGARTSRGAPFTGRPGMCIYSRLSGRGGFSGVGRVLFLLWMGAAGAGSDPST